tara:strand:+ start:182 stop:499 length:318 start_codon:yes stop_codon:yes gene_type:complete
MGRNFDGVKIDNRGGARKGAGRKPGSATKLTREIADRALQEGISPLEVMLFCMRDYWMEGNRDEAGKYAVMAAPYCHPRLTSVTANSDIKASLIVVDEFGDKIDI